MQQEITGPWKLELEEPVTIKCEVNDKPLIAEILELTNDPINYGFKIKFSDGIIVEATATEDGGWYVNPANYKDYIDVTEKDLEGFVCVMHSQWYKFEVKNNATDLLVWVSIEKENKYDFKVYYDGDYQFNLRYNKSRWESKSVRVFNPAPIDERIVIQVAKELERKIDFSLPV